MSETSPSIELRTAADLMRQRATAATMGPWKPMVLGSEGYLVLADWGTVRDRGRYRIARFGMKDWDTDKADAEYVASMHPGVALKIADWLEAVAASYAELEPGYQAFLAGDAGGDPDPIVAIARAYLGEDGTDVT